MKRKNTMCYVWAAVIVSLAASVACSAGIIHVDAEATGSNNGTCWADAYNSLQDALAEANTAGEPIEVRVAQGIYRPDQGAGMTQGDVQATFLIAGDVTLSGGYAGGAFPDANARDIERFPTALDGDLAGNDLPVTASFRDLYRNGWNEPSRTDNSHCVVTIAPVDPNGTVTLEGVTIRAAHSPDGMDPMARGMAGLYVEADARAVVRSCTFAGNTAPGLGSDGRDVTVVDCVFKDNLALAMGGGMWLAGDRSRVVRCLFEGNRALDGGGLYGAATDLQLEDCAFVGNTACGSDCYEIGFGGGFCCEWYARPVVSMTRCLFTRNTASAGGAVSFGALRLGLAPPLRSGVGSLTGCSFFGNQAREGGAVFAHRFAVDVEDTVFSQNSGGRTGGAVANWTSATSFVNCIFSGNTSQEEGGVLWAAGGGKEEERPTDMTEVWQNFEIVLSNCTLTGNTAPLGPAISCRSGKGENGDTAILSNCILDDGGYEIENPNGSAIAVAFTNLREGLAAVNDPCNAVAWGPDNLDVDPHFAQPGYWDANGTPDDINDDIWVNGDYHLQSQAGRWDPNGETWVIDEVTSPCIDAGDPNSPIGFEPFPNGGYVNMGAYGGTAQASKSYFGEPPCETIMAGDINGDCRVDFTDLLIVINHWHEDSIW